MNAKTCHCIVKHPTTTAERKVVRDALAYSRKVGDSFGAMLALAQLAGKCPARK
jgi:hypothetical protein